MEVVFVRNHCEGILREADREGNAETVYLSSSRILVRSVSDGTLFIGLGSSLYGFLYDTTTLLRENAKDDGRLGGAVLICPPC